ncbi:Error-prone repair protein UmuD [gamma proteobacterium IMCC2047]|nr:Error-prone repair protein UmuD [gamma proteobacterium IMCC2047]
MKANQLFRAELFKALPLPYFISQVPAGFPSPADDYMDKKLDLNEHLIQHPSATFYCRVSGSSMTAVGIFDDDLLIVDRALKPRQGDVVLAFVNGGLACKILDIRGKQLLPANDQYPPIPIREGTDFEVEGVVINSIRFHRVRTG